MTAERHVDRMLGALMGALTMAEDAEGIMIRFFGRTLTALTEGTDLPTPGSMEERLLQVGLCAFGAPSVLKAEASEENATVRWFQAWVGGCLHGGTDPYRFATESTMSFCMDAAEAAYQNSLVEMEEAYLQLHKKVSHAAISLYSHADVEGPLSHLRFVHQCTEASDIRTLKALKVQDEGLNLLMGFVWGLFHGAERMPQGESSAHLADLVSRGDEALQDALCPGSLHAFLQVAARKAVEL